MSTNSTTIAERTQLRNTIKDTEDKRILKPFDYNLLTPIIRSIYADIWPSILESKTACTVQVEYTPSVHDEFVAFLRGYILANSYNRDSVESHVAELIGWMRDGFSPASTNFAIDNKGAVRNGGHSSKAVLRGFFPQSDYYGLRGKPVIIEDVHVAYDDLEVDDTGLYFEGDDKLAYESVLPPMPTDTVLVNGEEIAKYPEVGEFDENGVYIPGTDTPEIRKYCIDSKGVKRPLQLIINISVFGPADALHRENTTLVPTAETYLNMSGCIKTHYAETIPLWLNGKMGNLLTMLRKRTMHGTKGGFGTVGRGGRMNGEDAPSWYLAYMPAILDSIALLSDSTGNQRPRPLFSPSKGSENTGAYKGGANLLQILVAMCVSDQAGRERIAQWVCWDASKDGKPSAELVKLSDVIRPPKTATVGTLPTDAVVEMLVLVGLGKTDPVEHFEQDWKAAVGKDGALESVSAWTLEENRASGWDRCDIDVLEDGEDILSTSLVEYAKQLSGEGSRAAKSATRKAPKGKPKGK